MLEYYDTLIKLVDSPDSRRNYRLGEGDTRADSRIQDTHSPLLGSHLDYARLNTCKESL